MPLAVSYKSFLFVAVATVLAACAPRATSANAINVTGAWTGTANAVEDDVIATIAFNMNLDQQPNGDFTGTMTVKGINSEPILVAGNLHTGKASALNRNATMEFDGTFTRTSYSGKFKLKYNVLSAIGTAQMIRR